MSQTKLRAIVLACVAVCCCTAPGRAEMMYSSSQRGIHGSGIQLSLKEETTDSLGVFEASLLHSNYLRDDENMIVGHESASVSQDSTLSDNQIRGLGRGSGFGSGGGDGVGAATLMVDFDIDQSMRFTLTGQLRIAPHGDSIGLNGSNAHIRLTGPDGVAMEVVLDEDNPPNGLGNVDFSGGNRLSEIFPAGSYTLEALAEGRGNNGKTRCVDFDFTLTALNAVAVPEPSAAGLAMFALLGITLRRRREEKA